MKCNNFDDILKQLEDVEKQELKTAVLAHGGLYRFEEEDRVTITFDTSDALIGASDVEICQVSVNDNGELVLSGIPRGEFHEIEFDPEDAAPGHLHYVTEAIPATDEVDSVASTVALVAPGGEGSANEALKTVRRTAVKTIKAVDETVVKRLFLFYGSLSVIQILEDNGIESRVNKMMSQSDAFGAAKRLIAEHFEKEGCDPWEYDLDLKVETYRGKDGKSVDLDIEHTLDNFEATHHFEDEDGSGNAQGFTSFTL